MVVSFFVAFCALRSAKILESDFFAGSAFAGSAFGGVGLVGLSSSALLCTSLSFFTTCGAMTG
ncbi:hypothetical protein KA405_04945 [Patescibacteria group bacterium]|nr:hypothetical protein [Patescibacteria group bacterium]